MANYSAGALLQVTASPSVYPLVVPLRYLGADPVASTKNIATKQFADTYFQQNSLVTANWVDSQADLARANVLLQSSMNNTLNAQDSSGNRVYPTVEQMKSIMNSYADNSRLGAAGVLSGGVLTQGVAKANSLGVVSRSDSPDLIPAGISTDNVAKFYNCITDPSSIVYLTSSYTIEQSTVPTAYKAATFTIPDPGFYYYPMNFVYIQGKSSGTASVRSQNSAPYNAGRILVAPSSATQTSLPTNWFALGTCTSSPYQNWHMALPYINPWTNTTLPVMPVAGTTSLRGDLTLNLYLSNVSGTGYTFYAAGMMWFILLVPTPKLSS